MEQFKLRNEFTGLMKTILRNYIESSKTFNPEQKEEALKELNNNWFDERFKSDKLIDTVIGYSIMEWRKQNFELVEFWKKVAIENSKINNAPHLVANETLLEFKNQFNLE